MTWVTFTLRTYAGLCRCAGTYTSRGASGNQPTAGTDPTDTVTLQPGRPIQPTSAGAYTGRATKRPGTQHQMPPTNAQRP